MELEDLYFGCLNYDFNTGKMEPFNLFRSMRVLHSIAIYKTHQEELANQEWFGGEFDPLRFCFGDLDGHVEYEMAVGSLFKDEPEKMSLWEMYVVPNEKLLMDMVDKVSVESCERWLEEHKQ